LFYNSLSTLGRIAWYDKEKTTLKDGTVQESSDNLMTRYAFIKNLPHLGFTYDLEPKEFYPNIKFELDYISLK
jgi:hypothetical protein